MREPARVVRRRAVLAPAAVAGPALLVAAAVVLAACGGSGSEPSSQAQQPGATAAAQTVADPTDSSAAGGPGDTTAATGTTEPFVGIGSEARPHPATTGAPLTLRTTTPASPPTTTEPAGVRRLTVEVVATSPHDTGSYTQGLVHQDGVLYESAGKYGESDVRRVDPASGAVLARRDNHPDEFGEGLALVEGTLWQLTWKEGTANELDAATLQLLRTVPYEGEGWGLCYDGRRLVMSDGSSRLTFRDPTTFAALGTVDVAMDGEPFEHLNELECVGGTIYANVYPSDEIVVIDPATGQVTATVDASPLRAMVGPLEGDEVLNGIAELAGTDRFLLTGKHWPAMFEVRFVPAASAG